MLARPRSATRFTHSPEDITVCASLSARQACSAPPRPALGRGPPAARRPGLGPPGHARARAAIPTTRWPAAAALPAGWSRPLPTSNAGTANVKVVADGQGHPRHARARPSSSTATSTAGTGPFHTLATFTQTKTSTHPEGYGLFFGGQALDGKGRSTPISSSGRTARTWSSGATATRPPTITKGWVASAAVQKPDAKGTATNLLEIDAQAATRARWSSRSTASRSTPWTPRPPT